VDTDVLSFPQDRPLVGDIVISVPYVRKQAEENEVSFDEEFYRILIHGALHLFGYDHEKDDDNKREMFAMQDKIFSAFMERKVK